MRERLCVNMWITEVDLLAFFHMLRGGLQGSPWPRLRKGIISHILLLLWINREVKYLKNIIKSLEGSL